MGHTRQKSLLYSHNFCQSCILMFGKFCLNIYNCRNLKQKEKAYVTAYPPLIFKILCSSLNITKEWKP